MAQEVPGVAVPGIVAAADPAAAVDPGAGTNPVEPPKRDQVAAVAVLDGVGAAFAVGATVLLVATEGLGSWWWLAVGLSVLFGVGTTVVLARLVTRRRAFRGQVADLVARFDGTQVPGPEVLAFARRLRSVALACGEARAAAELDHALARLGRQ